MLQGLPLASFSLSPLKSTKLPSCQPIPAIKKSHRPSWNPERDKKKEAKSRPKTEFYRVRLPFRLSGGSPAPGPAGSITLVLIRLGGAGLCRVCSQLQSSVFSAVWPLCTPKVSTGHNATAFSLPECNQVLYMHLIHIQCYRRAPRSQTPLPVKKME